MSRKIQISKWQGLVGVLALAALTAGPANAQSAADFYKGKTIKFSVGVGAGGNFALYARSFAPYFRKHMPGNPNVVVQYMPGGGGRKLAKYMHHVANKDGTQIAMTLHTVPFSQVVRPKGATFNAAEWNWIGNIAPLAGVLAVVNTAPATSLNGAKNKEVVLGASAKGSSTWLDPTLTNLFTGTKFRMVLGYRGANGLAKALEGGEIQGYAINFLSWKITRPSWIKSGRVRFLVQFGLQKDKDLPNVPLLIDLAPDKLSKLVARFAGTSNEIARAIFAPPGVPKDRVAAMRKAFDASVRDPGFLADAIKRNFEVLPATGAEVQKLVDSIVNAPPEVVSMVQRLAGPKKK